MRIPRPHSPFSDILWDCLDSAGTGSGDAWQQISGESFPTKVPLSLRTQNPSQRSSLFVNKWLEQHLLHTQEHIWTYQRWCLVRARLAAVVWELFYAAVWGWFFLLLRSPVGFHGILCVAAPLRLLENCSVCSVRKWTRYSCLSAALLRKHWCSFPPSISVYLCPWQRRQVVHIKWLRWLIIHDHLNKLQNAPWHFYWRQSTADETNVFLSGAIMTIKVSSGTWDQYLMTRLPPVRVSEISGNSSVFFTS